MQAMLKAKSLWSAIKGTLPLDTCNQDGCRKEEKAMAALVLSLGDEQLMHVQNAATAAEVWRKLKEVHERKGIATKLYLRCKVLTVLMEDGDGMLEHINKVKMMAHQLEVIGAKVDSEGIVTTLLYSLPESFGSLIVSLESRADDLTLEFLTTRLLHEETRRSEGQDGGGKDGRAFYGRSRVSNATMRKAGGLAFYCGKEGHFKKECKKRLAAEQQNSEANQASGHEAFAFSATSSRGGHWIFDSSASQHMTSNRAWLSNLQPLNNARVHLADNRIVEATEKGTATIQTALSNGGTTTCICKDVWEGLYALRQPLDAAAPCHAVAIRTTVANLEPWQRRLGHLNCQSVQVMAREGLVQGMETVGVLASAPCSTSRPPSCPSPRSARSSKASEVLELVHCDVCGTLRTLTIGGACYFVLFIDDKNRAVFPYLLKTKAETLPSFRIFAAAAATERGCLLKVLQSDHGGEYLSKAFSNFTQSLGIRHQLSSVATPQQNGVAERMNRTLVEMCCSKLDFPTSIGDIKFDEESLAGDPGKLDPAAQASTDMAEELSDAEDGLSQQGEVPGDASEQGGQLDGGSEQGEDLEDAQEHQPSPPPQEYWKLGTGLLAEATALVAEVQSSGSRQLKRNFTPCMPTTPGILLPCLQGISLSSASPSGCQRLLSIREVDYGKTFALVAKFSSVRMVLAFEANEDKELEQMDAATAFLNPDIVEEIYIELPEGFAIAWQEDLVCRLCRSLYGLKQSSCNWKQLLNASLKQLGFVQSNADNCIYTLHAQDPKSALYLLVSVDKMILAFKSMVQINHIKTELSKQIKMTDMGVLGLVLGVEITRDRPSRRLWLSQKHYLQKMLASFGMDNCKPVSTPMETSTRLTKAMEPQSDEERAQMARHANPTGVLLAA
ncbi:DNA-directed DNA polymerase [Powellomyces hirtus]|uniref:DNA-directed DNA polymerase n=1 Tax=Powellomyces hirtus TaxID=109895 RepID=A0A507DMX3_9FUNG|nr:DNA-directed DNA polymerase [Powellomyces hirtus]